MAVNRAGADAAFELVFPRREIVIVADRVEDHEAYIVPIANVFGPGIPEAAPDFHISHIRSGRSFVSRQKLAPERQN